LCRRRRNRDREPGFVAHAVPDERGDLGWWAEQPPRPRNVEERLVDAELLDERRHGRVDRHDLVALFGVAREPRRKKCRVWARLASAGHRHRRMHTKRTRFVTCRTDDSPIAETADDHRPAAQARVVELLDGSEERVEVDVEEGRAIAHGW